MVTPATDMNIVYLDAAMTRDKTSLPKLSVPNGCSTQGPMSLAAASVASGS